MFEDLMQHYTFGKDAYSNTNSPWSVVDYPRKLVLATLFAYIRGRYLFLMTCQKTQRIQKALRHNFLVNLSDTSFSSWSNEFFDSMLTFHGNEQASQQHILLRHPRDRGDVGHFKPVELASMKASIE